MRILIISILTFIANISYSQSALEHWSIAPSIRWGNMLKHTEKIVGPVAQNAFGMHIDFLYQSSGRKHWHHATRFPTFGFGIAYLNTNNKVYGSAIGIYPLLKIPILKTAQFRWDAQIAMGGAYINKKFDRTAAIQKHNVAISTHLNNYSPLSTDFEYNISEKVHLTAGAYFTHLSNGGFKLPNLGMNMYGVYIGFRYFPYGDQLKRYEAAGTPKVYKTNWGMMARSSIAYKASGPVGGPRLPSYLVDASVYKKYQSHKRVNLGIAYQYHGYKYFFEKANGADHEYSKAAAHQLALYLNHEFIFGNFGLITQLGYYIHNPVTESMRLYQKIGGQYYLYQNDRTFLKTAYVNLLLKTHTSNAELFEVGLGVGF